MLIYFQLDLPPMYASLRKSAGQILDDLDSMRLNQLESVLSVIKRILKPETMVRQPANQKYRCILTERRRKLHGIRWQGGKLNVLFTHEWWQRNVRFRFHRCKWAFTELWGGGFILQQS